jgi:transcriptional regulator with XRE-family HTH domain/DNA-binding NarL/FixJ family response regulator
LLLPPRLADQIAPRMLPTGATSQGLCSDLLHETDGEDMDQPVATHNVAYRIRRLRTQRGWSAQQLADQCGGALTRSTIAKIESGVRRIVTVEEIAVLAQAFQVDPQDLLAPHTEVDDLVDALLELSQTAGTSLRRLAAKAKISSETLAQFVAGVSVPEWGTVLSLVNVLNGNVDEFERLWRRAAEARRQQPHEVDAFQLPNAATNLTADQDETGSQRPTVFVSYAHDSAEHVRQVQKLAELLLALGVNVDFDRWAGPLRQDWATWATIGMAQADFVIVVASPAYRHAGDNWAFSTENRGAQHESAALRDLLHRDRPTWLSKILPVLLPGRSPDDIPLFLQPFTADHYRITEFSLVGAESLLRVITHQPAVTPSLGELQVSSPVELSRSTLDNLTIGTTLRRLRLDAGISLTELARRLGCSKGYLSKVENLRAAPSPDLMKRLDAEFGAYALLASSSAVTVVAIDPHPAVLAGVRAWCTSAVPVIDVISSATRVEDAWLDPAATADVVVLEVDLDGTGPAYEELRRFVDAGRSVVVYSGHTDQETVLMCLEMGAAGYLAKMEGETHLISAIRAAAANAPYVSPALAAALISDSHENRPTLTQRETEVLREWFRSASSEAAAEKLDLTVGDLRNHLDRVRLRYAAVGKDVSTKAALLANAIRDEIVRVADL